MKSGKERKEECKWQRIRKCRRGESGEKTERGKGGCRRGEGGREEVYWWPDGGEGGEGMRKKEREGTNTREAGKFAKRESAN